VLDESSWAFASVHKRFRVVWAAVHEICLMSCGRGLADAGLLMCVLDESSWAFTSVYKRFRVVWAAVHELCLMGSDWCLADADILMCVLDESSWAFTSVFGLSELQFMQLLWWAVMGGSSALAGPLNRPCMLYKSCAISDATGRVWKSNVGSSRYKSGQSGQISYTWTLAFGLAHVPS